MSAIRRLITASIVAAAAFAAPATAADGCGPSFVEVESLRIAMDQPIGTGSGSAAAATVVVRVARVGDVTGSGVDDTNVGVRRVVGGVRMAGYGVTGPRGTAVVRLTPTKAAVKGWHQRATAAHQTALGDGCTPGLLETGYLAL